MRIWKTARQTALGMAVTLALTTGLSIPSGPPAAAAEDDLYEHLNLLMRVFQRVQSEYVDEVDDREVIEAAIQGMLRSLDPHSTYLNPDVYQQVRVQMEGEYGGLGIEVQMEDGLVKVVSPIDDTPAAEAGIEGGDLISHIDGQAVMGQTLTEAVKKMRGPVGSPINITVIREGESDPFDVEIVRDRILVRSVRHRVEAETIGYIRVTTFNMQSGEGVEQAVTALKEELGGRMDGVILDLRNNPGGLLDEAVRISDAFVERGEIVSTRGRRRQNNNRWFATEGDMLDGLPMVVLVNAYSASASEIVAGALQDQRRALVIGDQTFGKGTVQSEIRLGRAGDQAIRLTTARYYTPSGRSIQERGIEPDIEVLFPRDKARKARKPRREKDLQNSIDNDTQDVDRAGEVDAMSEEEIAHIEALIEAQNDSDTAPEDIQLQYAIKLLKNISMLPIPQIAEARPE